MGIELAGGCTTTIFTSLGKDDVKFIINHSQVNYLFAGNKVLADLVTSIRSELPSLKGIICLTGLESGNGADLLTLDEIRKAGKELLDQVRQPVATSAVLPLMMCHNF
jgi:long-subunit acyl-CoA synthetase (AMP-forming)